MTITEQKTITVPEDDLRDWIEEINDVAYSAHRRHIACVGGIAFCGHDLCRTITAVTDVMAGLLPDRSAPQAIPAPPKPKARRPRARKTEAG